MNAWKGGGLYKGAPVTDEMVIAHWNGRLAQLDPRDPLYDTYKTAVMQYTYAIEESKVRTLYEQGKMTDELRVKILKCITKTALEDLYLPFKPKRRTRAMIAKEKGLEPLAVSRGPAVSVGSTNSHPRGRGNSAAAACSAST